MLNTTKAFRAIGFCGQLLLQRKQYSLVNISATLNGINKRYKTTCCCDGGTTDYDMSEAFTHTPELGYIRQSVISPLVLPNERIDQYVWKDVQKWQDKTALVNS